MGIKRISKLRFLMITDPMADKITSKELQAQKDEYEIVDVREADELEDGKIDGALSMPLGHLIRKARHGDLNDLKGKKIVIIVLVDIEEIWLQMS
jgi:rhodanese-related sulfurtransferase